MKHLSEMMETSDLTYRSSPKDNSLILKGHGYDDTVVHLGDADCLTITQETEFGEEMTVVLSREMLQNLWPNLNLWLKLP